MSLSTMVKGIQDIMRKDAGVDGDAQRINQMVWLIFLKVFDDNEQTFELMQDDYQSPIPEPLRWRTWASDPEGITGEAMLDFVNGELFPTLSELPPVTPRAKMVRDIFAESYNYMKNGTLLRQVVNKLNEADFTTRKDKHVFGDIYAQILKDLQSAGNAGEFYTPRAVTQFMVDMVNPQPGEVVLDPACGTGGFLTAALEKVRENAQATGETPEDLNQLHINIRGVEKKQMPFSLCVTNLLLHDVDIPAVKHDNTLKEGIGDPLEQMIYDVVVTNPPFGGVEEDGIESSFPAQFQTRETADLFLAYIMHVLKPGGRAALVLPDGTLFGEGVKTRIKEKLLTENNLHTIVRLPNGVFNPYTGIKTNLLFFEKGTPTTEVWYYEHPYPEGYKSYSKTKPMKISEFDTEKAWWQDRKETPQAWRVSATDIQANGYNLDIKNPHEVEDDHGDPAELLAHYGEVTQQVQNTRDTLRSVLEAALAETGN